MVPYCEKFLAPNSVTCQLWGGSIVRFFPDVFFIFYFSKYFNLFVFLKLFFGLCLKYLMIILYFFLILILF